MSKERTRRYRERLAQDEARHEEILRERRRKYQEKKAKGEIQPRNITSLPKHKRAKLREQWKKTKARNRKKKEDLAAILDITPPSPEALDVSFSPVNLSPAHGSISPIPSPPERVCPPKLTAKIKRLERENKKLKAMLDGMKKANSKMRIQKHRWNKAKKARQPTLRSSTKRAATQKKQQVTNFLSRDENSRLLAGKRDTVGRKNNKIQLHSEYNQESSFTMQMSYRQFARYRPKHITETRPTDRNTCACYQHENKRLLIDSLVFKGMISTKSLSNLLSSITCNTEEQKCMYRQCTNCCFDEVRLKSHNPDEFARWEQWERVKVTVGEKVFTNWVKKGVEGTLGKLQRPSSVTWSQLPPINSMGCTNQPK
ncbi:uncharacterized protein [Chanodichthys erythropterus]|uniref:uncharacterized protein n=1 Tax=Chanodichthys erythropterus TaxID=933992 RepID=UPI00351F3A15